MSEHVLNILKDQDAFSCSKVCGSYNVKENKKIVKDLLESGVQEICSKKINKAFGLKSINNSDIAIVAFKEIKIESKRTRSGREHVLLKKVVCGFVLCNYVEKSNELYVDLICSPSVSGFIVRGVKLLNCVEELAVWLKCSHIHLSALEDVFCYYAKLGYVACDRPCELDKESECAPSQKKRMKGSDEEGWRMKKCLEEPIRRQISEKIKYGRYNIPRRCKTDKTRSSDLNRRRMNSEYLEKKKKERKTVQTGDNELHWKTSGKRTSVLRRGGATENAKYNQI
jgi:hypothetical protein